jgi:beta-lactamase superfamily II metal-dependent hydrolase
MSYVVTLEDGRYVIFDGGYYNKTNGKDHHILYNYLKDNNKRKDGKIVIAAWILTHDHSDHHGAFTNFALDYSSNVELQYYISNFGDKSRYDDKPSGWLDTGIPNDLVAPCYKNAKKIVPHTGQKITFCNTTFELLCCQESHVPNKIEWVNDASLIFKMTSNGVSTLFLADAEAQTTNLLNKMYGSTLKSDIMQIAHHGYSGGSISLYQNIDPSWTLWPTNQTCFEERTTDRGIGNAHAQNKWARNNSTCFVGDGNIEILKFVGGASKISISTYTPKNYKV